MLNSHPDLFYLEVPELLAVVKRQKNLRLLRWMRQHDAQLGGEVLEYALSAGDVGVRRTSLVTRCGGKHYVQPCA